MNIFIKTNFNNSTYLRTYHGNTKIYNIVYDYLQQFDIKINIDLCYILYKNKNIKMDSTLFQNNFKNDDELVLNYNFYNSYCSICSNKFLA